jgi:hypothetical protein
VPHSCRVLCGMGGVSAAPSFRSLIPLGWDATPPHCHPERVFRARRTPILHAPPQPSTPFSPKKLRTCICLTGGSRGLQPRVSP